MSSVAGSIAAVAVPAVINFAGGWASRAIQTWGPSTVANSTIDQTAEAGKRLFGGSGVMGSIGYGLGKAAGFVAAPYVAQSSGAQAALGIGTAVVGAAAKVAADHFAKKLQQEKPAPAVVDFQAAYAQQKLMQHSSTDMAALVATISKGQKANIDVAALAADMPNADAATIDRMVDRLIAAKAAAAA